MTGTTGATYTDNDAHLLILEIPTVLANLSPREREYLTLRYEGCSLREIMRRMQIAERTLWHHRRACQRYFELFERGETIDYTTIRRFET